MVGFFLGKFILFYFLVLMLVVTNIICSSIL
jgi:hypothetical protein